MCFAPQRRATFHLSSDHMAPHSPRLREPTFRPSGGFRDLPTFSRTWNFFLLTLSLFDLLSSSLIFFDSSHLCFSSVHIVGSLTSKLPSNSAIYRTSMPSCVCVCMSVLHRNPVIRTRKPYARYFDLSVCKGERWVVRCDPRKACRLSRQLHERQG